MKPLYYVVLWVLFAVLFAIGVNSWSRQETLACDRDSKHVQCTVTRESWFTSSTTLYPDVVDIRELDLTRDQWALTLVDPQGRIEDVVEEISETEAKRGVAAFVVRDAHFEVARSRYPVRGALFSLTMLLLLIGITAGLVLQRRATRARTALEESQRDDEP